MWKKVELIVIVLMIAGLLVLSRNIREYVSANVMEVQEKVVVLDPGHGGNDPGKIGTNGAYEKDINLQIALEIRDLLEEKGIRVILTREKDEMLAAESSNNKKRDDMRRRVKIIEEAKADLVISIHQNSFTDALARGAQVFYYEDSSEGKQMAGVMQEALRKIDSENQREAKGNTSYYLLKNATAPTLIVECGFLSNPAEAELLITEEYQQKIASAIVKGIQSVV